MTMGFKVFRGFGLTQISLGPICVCVSRGQVWFRIFGVGLSIAGLSTARRLRGLRKRILKVGPLGIRYLKRSDYLRRCSWTLKDWGQNIDIDDNAPAASPAGLGKGQGRCIRYTIRDEFCDPRKVVKP